MRTLFLLLVLFASISAFSQFDEQDIDGTKLFANAVAIDGDYAVVGNMAQTGTFMGGVYEGTGMVSIFKRLPNGNWVHFQDIDEPLYFGYDNNPAQAIGKYYGCSVDIDGENIIVGAYDYDSDMLGNIGPDGVAFIYSYDVVQDIFVKVATLAPEVAVRNEFGWSVAISGDWAVVGDPSEEHPLAGGVIDRENIGCAHVYHFDGAFWNHHTKLIASNGWGSPEAGGIGEGDAFGYAVAIDGDVIAVGAPNQGIGSGTAQGAVYIYEWDLANWNETFLKAAVPVQNSKFGSSVGVSGDYMVAGAPGILGGALAGSIHLFHNNGNWGVGTSQAATDSQIGNMFGCSVSIATNQLVAGAYGFANETGKAYIYNFNNGMFETQLQALDIEVGDAYGYSCSISDSHLIIGSPMTERDPIDPLQEGTAYFYSMGIPFGGLWTGAVNTDWGNPNNWQDLNVPNGLTDVLIDGFAPNQPLVANMIANCKNLTIDVGATVSVSLATGELNVNGNFNNLGQLLNVAKSKNPEPSLKVLGVTTFGGAGQQDIPGGSYHEFHYDCGANSSINSDVVINGDFHHDNNYKLFIEDNTLSLAGQIWGTQRKIIFDQTSSLELFGERDSDFVMPGNIADLNNLTVNIPGNDAVFLNTMFITVNGQLSLLDGDVFMGFDTDVNLTLYNPIVEGDGRLLAHPNGGKSSLVIMDNGKADDQFYIPSTLSELSSFWVSRTAPTLLRANLQVNDLYALYTATFDVNGYSVVLGPDADMWIGGDAQITQDMVGGDGTIDAITINSGSPEFDFDAEVEGDLNIGAGAGQVGISPGRCITVNGTTTVGANLVLRSDASGSACFIDNGPVVYSSKADANIIVENYIPSKDEWHYVSSPVQNSTAQFFAGAYLNAYNPDEMQWEPFTNLNQAVNTMQGYSTKLPVNFSGQKFEFSGELNTAQSAPLNIALSDGGDGYNLVGNPFPSTIDWDDANWTKTNLANAIYLWNAGTGSYTSYVNGAGVNGGSQYIAAMQGFFVEATGSNPSLHIDNNNVRKVNEATFLKSDEEIENQLLIQILNSNEIDEAMIRFVEGASPQFDKEFDARKLFGRNSLAQIYIQNSNEDELSIQTFNSIKETDLVPLGLQIEESGEYELFFNMQNSFSEHVSIILEDKKNNDFISLQNQRSYLFHYDSEEEPQRFILHFKDVTGVSEMDESEIMVYSAQDQIYITNNSEEIFNSIDLYNIAGQLIQKNTLSDDRIQKISSINLSNGTYLIQLNSRKKSVKRKIIINR